MMKVHAVLRLFNDSLALILLMVLASLSAADAQHPPFIASTWQRLKPSAIAEAQRAQQYPQNIADYIAFYNKAILQAAPIATERSLSTQQLLLKAPFYLEPAASCAKNQPRRGVLLVHGLSDSPYFMRGIANFFQQRCFSVLAIVLPGHATQPGDLLTVKYQDWLDAVAYGFNQLRPHADELHAVGFSIGAALVLNSPQILQHTKALWLYVPALHIKARALLGLAAPWLGWLNEKAAWHVILPDQDPYKYESSPLHTIAQATLLTRRINKQLENQHQLPALFVAATGEDSTVDADATLQFFSRWPNPSKYLLWFANVAPRLHLEATQMHYMKAEVAPDILSMAHTAMMIPPVDPVYGRRGWYHDCRYYFTRDSAAYDQCKAGMAPYRGEHFAENLQRGVVERLRYNPHWDAMLNRMDLFLKSLDEV